MAEDDDSIMRPIYVERENAHQMEIKDGFFWYNGVQTDWSFMEVGIR